MDAGRPPFFSKRRLRRWLIFGVVAIASWLIASLGVAYSLTHRSQAPFREPAPEVPWGPLASYRIATIDGQGIGAWYAEGEDDAPSVLLLHGNGGSRRNVLSRAAILASEGGCAVLLISLRAHGDSTGRVNDIGFGARRDVIAGVEFLRSRRPGQPVIVLGTSLGAASAIFAAEELGDRVQGYILESPYRDLKTAVWNRTAAYLPPVLDRVAYAGLRITAPLILPDFERIAPIRAIGQIPDDVPILLLAGGADPLARPEEAMALYRRVESHGRIAIFPDAGHHDLLEADPKRYRRLLLNFCVGDRRIGMD